MKKIDFANLAKNLKNGIIKHSPEILTGIGIAGFITTTVMAVKATPKAMQLIDEKKNEMKVHNLTPMETVKTTWKVYIPTVVSGGLSIAALVSANRIDSKRKAALATAYTLAESTLREYQTKVIDTIGEKKEQKIKDEIAKDHVQEAFKNTNDVILVGGDDIWCFDMISGRKFKSNLNKIKEVVNDLNFKLINEMYVPSNEFYYGVGLQCTPLGNELGWNINEGKIEPHYSSQLLEDGTPVLVVDYYVKPRYDYEKLL